MRQHGSKPTWGKQKAVKPIATPDKFLLSADLMCWICRMRTLTTGSNCRAPTHPDLLSSHWEAENEAVAGFVHAVLQNQAHEWHTGSARDTRQEAWHGCRLALRAVPSLQNEVSSL